MPKYIKLYTQFLGFVNSLDANTLSVYEKKIINLLIRHFDNIKDKGTAQGQRSSYIYGIIEQHGETLPSEITILDAGSQEGTVEIKKLKSLELQHFRGFSEKKTFDLSKQYTFIYGPNGTGKSSMFEALEYSMLGYIQGAIDKTIEIKEYIKNHFTDQQVDPILNGFKDGGSADVVTPNPKYAFCFIEKSRIDQFARISANTEKAMEKQLAFLFGLDEFNKFANDFKQKADKYFHIDNVKEKDLAEKSIAITMKRNSITEEKAQIDSHAITIQGIITANGYQTAKEFEQAYLKAAEGQKTKAEEIQEKLKQSAPSLLKFKTVAEIQAQVDSIQETYNSLTATLENLAARKSEIQFKDLFQSALAVETPSLKACPLCETPISEVTIHPFENARAKLEKLQEVILMETTAETLYNTLYELVVALDTSVALLSTALIAGGRQAVSFAAAETLEKDKENMRMVRDRYQIVKNGLATNLTILNQGQEYLDALNKSIQAQIDARKTLEEELRTIQGVKENYQRETTLISGFEAHIAKWQKEVEEFEKNNATALAEVKAEKEKIAKNTLWLAGYESIVEKLKKYMEGLPLNYVGELSEVTRDIFNHINERDKAYEKAESITLPKSTEDKIEIRYFNDPTKSYNVLCVLSEGHLRCLGLAILIAKNIKESCPVIIFDDVVNAIDTEHRGGIRELLFNYEPLQAKQIIITTHDDDFATKLAGKISKEDFPTLVQTYNFNLDETCRKILVDKDSKNNLHNAFSEYGKSKIFDAMKTARLALESIGYELWGKLSKIQRTPVPGYYPEGKYDLNGLIAALNSFIRTKKIEKYSGLCEHLDYLLQPGIWKYFNMASHEGDDRPQLDKDIVKDILDKLALLDGMLKMKPVAKKAKVEGVTPKASDPLNFPEAISGQMALF